MVEARHLKADDDEPLVIASEIMHRVVPVATGTGTPA
jgi:hypothetical protein